MTRTAIAAAAWALLAGAVGCDDGAGTVVLVTVDARPTTRPVTALEVTIRNDNATIVETFDVGGRAFPLTFTVTAGGRQGTLTVDAVATSGEGLLRATGAGSAAIVPDGRADLLVMLEPTDFVVNSSIAGTQRLTFLLGRNGRQLSTADDGSFLIAFVNDCMTLGRCDVLARRFGPDAAPARNGVSMDSAEFIVNLSDEYTEVPAVAIGPEGMFVAWASLTDVRGVALAPDAGHRTAADTVLSVGDDLPADPVVAAFPDGSYVVVWSERDFAGGGGIFGRLVTAEGAPRFNPVSGDTGRFAISTTSSDRVALPDVAATGQGLGFAVAWQDDNNVFARFFGSGGQALTGSQVALTSHSSSATIAGPQVAWTGAEMVATWGVRDVATAGLEDGVYVLRRFQPPSAVPVGPAVRLSEATPDTISAPALAVRRSDGALAATWHQCGADGDGSGCGVYMQLMRPTGLPVGPLARVNTTVQNDQTEPAVAATDDAFVLAWSDGSMQPPDESGGAVRARVVYPPYDVADGRGGARCGRAGDAPCGNELVCLVGTENVPLCHPACDPAGAPCQAGICTTVGGESGCLL